MIKIIFSFLALLSITSCASFQMNLLNPKQTISPQLPYIEAQFDVTSIESAYTLGSTTGGASTIGAANWNFNKNRAFGLGTSFTALNTTSFRDKRVQDAITIFKREVENNICDNAIDNKKGIAVCRIAAADTSKNWGWFVPYCLTLCTSALFGIPPLSYTVEIDAQIDIYDNQNNLIKKYSALGNDTEYCALYWGYTESNGARTAAAVALLNALKDIKTQIQTDQVALSRKLVAR